MPNVKRLILDWIGYTDRSDSARRLWIIFTHCSIFTASALISFLLRFEFNIPRDELNSFYTATITWIVIKLLVFHIAGLNRGWWRFVSVHDIRLLAIANTTASAISFAVISLATSGFPRSVYIIDLLVCFLSTSGMRILVRVMMEAGIQIQRTGARKRLLIYGAGMAGQSILREIRSNPQLVCTVCGFLDDDVHKRGISIQGVRVLGTGENLAKAVTEEAIDEVLIAMPSASGSQITKILERCHQAKTSCKTIPSLGDMVDGKGLATQIRDVAVEDLLGRTPARLEQDRISAKLTGNTVLVTGAAGSIGSELCRQIARFNPRALIGFEIAETALFHLDREMRQCFPKVPFFPEIGSIQSHQRLAEVLEQYRPSIVYHAAAYKHVPMMEAHVFEAVENNVFGTRNVALAAAQHAVDDFVMISSDKAVRPTNVMGATKRAAELLILELQNGGNGSFVSVRFGNVLGSNGSVIPIFKQQIAAGGPITVTHPEMRRYFMTIPEASQLVLQSSAMGRGGEIFVLDMGEPVRIIDLARNLLLLSGLRPDDDIKIEFTGVRPGEKLYEELNLLDEETLPTHHEKIKIFAGNGLPRAGMESYLEALRDICDRRDLPGLILTLKDLIPDYNPSAHLLNRALSGSSVGRQTATRERTMSAGCQPFLR
jgi:FlaA1/EpsC-like NDP-sugar epimerase